jgi:hypothetical protein
MPSTCLKASSLKTFFVTSLINDAEFALIIDSLEEDG